METEATYEIDTVDADASTALATPRPEEIDVEILRSYLTSWKQGGQQVTQFTARGVQHLAQMLNLSIVSTEWVETSSGEGFYGKAVAENLSTGQRAHPGLN